MVNIIFNGEVMIELMLLWGESSEVEGEVDALHHGHEFLLSFSSFVIESCDGDKGFS